MFCVNVSHNELNTLVSYKIDGIYQSKLTEIYLLINARRVNILNVQK